MPPVAMTCCCRYFHSCRRTLPLERHRWWAVPPRRGLRRRRTASRLRRLRGRYPHKTSRRSHPCTWLPREPVPGALLLTGRLRHRQCCCELLALHAMATAANDSWRVRVPQAKHVRRPSMLCFSHGWKLKLLVLFGHREAPLGLREGPGFGLEEVSSSCPRDSAPSGLWPPCAGTSQQPAFTQTQAAPPSQQPARSQQPAHPAASTATLIPPVHPPGSPASYSRAPSWSPQRDAVPARSGSVGDRSRGSGGSNSRGQAQPGSSRGRSRSPDRSRLQQRRSRSRSPARRPFHYSRQSPWQHADPHVARDAAWWGVSPALAAKLQEAQVGALLMTSMICLIM